MCKACQTHYGDHGPCDEGKPVASPHRTAGPDCVWYWDGGASRGEWRRADPGTREAIRRGGRVAHDGRLSIGAPEGPPSADEIAEVLGLKS